MAVALALLVFKMPAVLVATAAGHGVIFGLLRIAWIVVGSIFLYNVASETGQFQVMKNSMAGLSSDKRLQLALIAFCFGAFLEGTGGGGAPVAIAGAFLMGFMSPPQALGPHLKLHLVRRSKIARPVSRTSPEQNSNRKHRALKYNARF